MVTISEAGDMSGGYWALAVLGENIRRSTAEHRASGRQCRNHYSGQRGRLILARLSYHLVAHFKLAGQ